jgi:hypothetical protein
LISPSGRVAFKKIVSVDGALVGSKVGPEVGPDVGSEVGLAVLNGAL